MTSTHALFGASVGAVAAVLSPPLAPAAVALGFVGGAVPDLDLLWTHRRTTHFPVYGPLLAALVLGLALHAGTEAALLVAVFAVALGLHPLMDALCGGVEARPWEATSDRAVYDHARGRWVRPRRLVRYAGAPEDLLVATAFALPALAVTAGAARGGLFAVLLASAGFVAVRRRIPSLLESGAGEDAVDG